MVKHVIPNSVTVSEQICRSASEGQEAKDAGYTAITLKVVVPSADSRTT